MDEIFFDNRIAGLIIKYHQEQVSESEFQELQAWADSSERAREIFEELTSGEKLPGEIAQFMDSRKRVLAKIHEAEPETRVVVEMNRSFGWKYWLAAAVVVGIAITGYWLVIKSDAVEPPAIVEQKSTLNDAAPGKDGAILTLPDGRTIVLDDANDGDIVNNVTKQGGKLVYKPGTATEFHTMKTPKGRTYKVELSDGSLVWLNAASSLYYPTSFTNERRVEVTGEAYFEVVKDATKKFIVVTKNGSTEVLGTSFNVNTYEDENESKVTLLEGSIKLTSGTNSVVMKPGQQALISMQPSSKEIKLNSSVDVDVVMAWKNGLFKFQSTPIQEMMRQVARWYDVQVEFEDNIKNDPITGTMQRNLNASEALEILTYMGYKFKIEGKKITVKS